MSQQTSPRQSAIAVFDDTVHSKSIGKKTTSLTIEDETDGSSNQRNNALIMALVMTTLRYHNDLKQLSRTFLSKDLKPREHFAQSALCVALASLICLKHPPHAVINDSVNAVKANVKTAHLAGLVNAVLRKASQDDTITEKLDRIVEQNPDHNLPDWLKKRWNHAYGQQCASTIAQNMRHQPPLTLIFKTQTDASNWAANHLGCAEACEQNPNATVTLIKPHQTVSHLPGYDEGDFWVQDLGASIPVQCLNIQHNERVLELCAAPGGKTMQLAAMGAQVIAVEKASHKHKRLKENLERTGLIDRVSLIEADATTLEAQHYGTFDTIVLDAPCTATGTLRRHPEGLFYKQSEDISVMAQLQTQLLHSAAHLLNRGGTLLYITCSLEPEEGEAQIERAIEDLPLKISPITPDDHPLLTQEHIHNSCIRLTPAHFGMRGGCDGFFAARLIKT